ncbi:MAG: hypothetical protein M0P59_13470 [Gallionella sp.]|jgi:hypothetical protein|nr:hypothetical protein [Gallionella sp.]
MKSNTNPSQPVENPYASGSPRVGTTLKEELRTVKASARRTRHEPTYYIPYPSQPVEKKCGVCRKPGHRREHCMEFLNSSPQEKLCTCKRISDTNRYDDPNCPIHSQPVESIYCICPKAVISGGICYSCNKEVYRSSQPVSPDERGEIVEEIKAIEHNHQVLLDFARLLVKQKKELMDKIYEKVKLYHKTCLTDDFDNGKFWAYKEMQEFILKEK